MTPSRLALLGHPVAHSLSPRFQNAALDAAGIALRYETIDVTPAGLERIVALLVEADAAGNATIPHKESLFRLARERTAIAERVGAVNTFWVERGQLVGDNTDVGGFDVAARELLGDATTEVRVAVLGAGGSSAAVLAAVERWAGAKARVWGRSPARAYALASRFAHCSEGVARIEDAVAGATLVVNATPVGLEGDELPIPIHLLPKHCAVLDLTYRRTETPFVVAARAAGHAAADGKRMLLEQGALAFERWFGRQPDRAAMQRALDL
ncbi:MAG: shikimate dehydrogenase [Gemmatimonadaceae bacterium]|nr:shikimate dehydrogenase [Gemmatimonadaceae bacterium]